MTDALCDVILPVFQDISNIHGNAPPSKSNILIFHYLEMKRDLRVLIEDSTPNRKEINIYQVGAPKYMQLAKVDKFLSYNPPCKTTIGQVGQGSDFLQKSNTSSSSGGKTQNTNWADRGEWQNTKDTQESQVMQII